MPSGQDEALKAVATAASTVQVDGLGWAYATGAIADVMDQFDDGAYEDLRETP